MVSIEDIRRPIQREIDIYESYLKDSFRSGYPFIQSVLNHIISGRGKGVRPLLTLLCSALHNGGGSKLPTESSIAAMLIEMIHNASLVHDDIVDEAIMRRGKESVNKLFKTHAAVLVGDYILARCYALGLESGVHEILFHITRSMSELCEGELIQNNQTEHLDMTRGIYYDIIYKKTATLIGTSCIAGALSVGASAQDAERIKEFGDMLGMAFQIKDDILDYSGPEKTGKPKCGDIRERKINLPLLTVLEESSSEEAAHIVGLLDGVSDDPDNVDKLCAIVRDRGGIGKATDVMNGFISKARGILDLYPDTPIRRSLSDLCTFIAEREK